MSTETGQKERAAYQVPGLSKGIQLIELLSESPESLGVSELAQKLEMNKHMVFRILQTLIRQRWVVAEGETPKYRLTLIPYYHVSKPILRNSLVEMATEPIRQYWYGVGESTSLGILDGDRILYVMHLNSLRDVAIIGQVGRRYYLHCSAGGKVLLAYSDPKFQKKILQDNLEPMTVHTMTSPRQLQEELELIRRQGYAIDHEEYALGLLCFAAPIFDYTGKVVGALNTSVLKMHYTVEELEKNIGLKMLEVCRNISTTLGYEKS